MSKIWSKEETLWSFALYGTAVGAGTLFLPIQLGSAGAIVLFLTALVARPLTYWPHKALCQFILSAKVAAGEGSPARSIITTAKSRQSDHQPVLSRLLRSDPDLRRGNH